MEKAPSDAANILVCVGVFRYRMGRVSTWAASSCWCDFRSRRSSSTGKCFS
ncbi:hypothetical protein BJX68DRAFT_85930 [Aspergillus pseudodeflectus]|uniref:Uncharacterized protein n=1 Tax=Aspergillus pseudodeflectus TaxID=176178 RepID=A0ABR4L7F0_9EURO